MLILLLAKKYLVHSGKVKITINSDTVVEAESGKTLLSTLPIRIFSFPQPVAERAAAVSVKCQVFSGGGDILPTEKFTSRANSSRIIGVSAVR